MGEYEIIDRLCAVSNELLTIVKKQAEIIEQSDVPEELTIELEKDRKTVTDKLDVIEYKLREYL